MVVRLMPGNRYDGAEVPPLVDGLIADKAFDTNALVAQLTMNLHSC